MSETSSQRTPSLIIEKLYCPSKLCECARAGGKLLATVKYQKGDSLELETICPNNKKRVLVFNLGAAR
jgi:hypothetical protein